MVGSGLGMKRRHHFLGDIEHRAQPILVRLMIKSGTRGWVVCDMQNDERRGFELCLARRPDQGQPRIFREVDGSENRSVGG